MQKYTFYAVIEYGLGDYEQIPYEWEVTDEQMALIENAAAEKKDFSEAEELHDLYQEVLEAAFEKEKARYNEKLEMDGLQPDDEVIAFESHVFYLTF